MKLRRPALAAALCTVLMTAAAEDAPDTKPRAGSPAGEQNAADRPAGTDAPRQPAPRARSPAPFTPSEKVTADAAVRFPVDI